MAAASSSVAPVNGGAAAAAEDAPWPPEMEARYQRLEKVGQGIFGRVYKARDRVDGQIVAVKQLSGRGGGPCVQTGLFELAREAISLKQCRGHPSVVELRTTHADKRDSEGDSFIVMEYAGRMNLRACMASRGLRRHPFREAEVRGIMRQLLTGVERSHQEGILHRDIKPENVVIDDAAADRLQKKSKQPSQEITCKICDFGASEPMTKSKREYSSLAASVPYRAPELFLGSTDYDGRVDTWGLGCVMAELLAGTGGIATFFDGKTEDDVLANMLEVVGARGIKGWLALHRPAGRRHPAAEELVRDCPDAGRLRMLFPEKVLSEAGFEVLSGLLESSPEGRLTAAEALQKPWFTDERRRGGPRRAFFGGWFMSCA